MTPGRGKDGLSSGSAFSLNTGDRRQRGEGGAGGGRDKDRRLQERSPPLPPRPVEGDSVRRPGGEPPQPSRDAHVCSSVGLRILWCGVPERRAALVLRIVGACSPPAPPGERVSRPPGVVARSRDRRDLYLEQEPSSLRVLAISLPGATMTRWPAGSRFGSLGSSHWPRSCCRGGLSAERSRIPGRRQSRPARSQVSFGADSCSRTSDL
jgi:hypothetical protein